MTFAFIISLFISTDYSVSRLLSILCHVFVTSASVTLSLFGYLSYDLFLLCIILIYQSLHLFHFFATRGACIILVFTKSSLCISCIYVASVDAPVIINQSYTRLLRDHTYYSHKVYSYYYWHVQYPRVILGTIQSCNMNYRVFLTLKTIPLQFLLSRITKLRKTKRNTLYMLSVVL